MEDEIATNHAPQIPESAYSKLLNAIVRIEVEAGEGTGFFLKFKRKEKFFFSLFTNYHVISQDLVNSCKTINVYYGIKSNETKRQIKLDKTERFIKCFEKPKDVTVIEILKNDNIPEDKYLLPDINYKNGGFNIYSNSGFYLAGYPSVDDIYNQYEGERHVSSGKIKNIFNNYEFEHNLDTRRGSSGSPICLISNKNVIGIHKSGSKKESINYGTFLGIILDEIDEDKIDVVVSYGRHKFKIKVNPNDKISILLNGAIEDEKFRKEEEIFGKEKRVVVFGKIIAHPDTTFKDYCKGKRNMIVRIVPEIMGG